MRRANWPRRCAPPPGWRRTSLLRSRCTANKRHFTANPRHSNRIVLTHPGGLPVQVTGVGVVKEYVTAGEYFGELAVLTDGSEVRHSLGQPNQRPAASHCCSCCCCTSLLARACTICRWLSRSPTRATTAGQTQGGRHHQDRRAPNGGAEADPGGVPPSHLRQARGGHPAPLLPRLRQDLRAAVVRGRQD